MCLLISYPQIHCGGGLGGTGLSSFHTSIWSWDLRHQHPVLGYDFFASSWFGFWLNLWFRFTLTLSPLSRYFEVFIVQTFFWNTVDFNFLPFHWLQPFAKGFLIQMGPRIAWVRLECSSLKRLFSRIKSSFCFGVHFYGCPESPLCFALAVSPALTFQFLVSSSSHHHASQTIDEIVAIWHPRTSAFATC